MKNPIVFLDTETTGLDSTTHELLEVGAIARGMKAHLPDVEIHFSLRIDRSKADPQALEINRFDERAEELASILRTDEVAAARELIAVLSGATVVGNNVGFDLRFVKAWFERCGMLVTEPWHYAPLDLKAYVAGRCGSPRPASTKLIAEVSGVEIPADAHSALVDTRWNRDVYDRLRLGVL